MPTKTIDKTDLTVFEYIFGWQFQETIEEMVPDEIHKCVYQC